MNVNSDKRSATTAMTNNTAGEEEEEEKVLLFAGNVLYWLFFRLCGSQQDNLHDATLISFLHVQR